MFSIKTAIFLSIFIFSFVFSPSILFEKTKVLHVFKFTLWNYLNPCWERLFTGGIMITGQKVMFSIWGLFVVDVGQALCS